MPPQLPDPFSDGAAGPLRRDAAPPRVSALAVTGLVLALVPCCPLTGLAGAFLGILALRRIRAARLAAAGSRAVPLRGDRLAVAAILVGVSSALVWSIAADRFYEAQESARRTAMQETAARFMRAATGGNGAAALDTWDPSDPRRPAVEAVEAFGRAATERYGAFERIAIISTSQAGSILAPAAEASGVFRFERESPLGIARFEMRVVPGSLTPGFRLTGLVIEDRTRGDLTLGRTTTSGAGPAPPDAAAPARDGGPDG